MQAHKRPTWDIQFVLVVDDFGIQYVYDDDLQHLLNALKDR